MNRTAAAICRYLAEFYDESDFSVLKLQIDRWGNEAASPLSGRKILDGTPIFRNTMLKYCALIAAGAELTVSVGDGIPCDPAIVAILPRFGIRVADRAALTETFDAVSDCGGRHRQVASRTGYVELTRTGLDYYRECRRPVLDVDSSAFKDFETAYGTGDGFVRAMRQAGYGDFAGRNIVVFGGGKVGLGVAGRSLRAGAAVTVIDLKRPELLNAEIRFIPAAAANEVRVALSDAWCVVSATGVPGALAGWADDLAAGNALIANMGVEDEFSPRLPAERVMNGKTPLNFILDEPTRMCFIAPVMAAANQGMRRLLSGPPLPPGLQDLPPDVSLEMLLDLAEVGIDPDHV